MGTVFVNLESAHATCGGALFHRQGIVVPTVAKGLAADGSGTMQLSRLALKYIAQRHGAGEINRRTAEVMRGLLLNFAAVAPTPIERVRARHVEAWIQQPGLTAGYRKNRLSTLRCFFRWCLIRRHVRADPTIGLTTPKVPKGLPRSLQTDDARLIVAHAEDTRARLICLLMLQEACRRIEVSRLLLTDVDFRNRRLGLRGKGGTGDVTRRVWLSDETLSVLRTYMAEKETASGPLIRSDKHPDRGIGEAHVSRIVRRAMNAAGVKQFPHDGITPHCLRHTALTDMVDEGANMRDVQQAAGHAQLVTTERYTLAAATNLQAAMSGRTYLAHTDTTREHVGTARPTTERHQ